MKFRGISAKLNIVGGLFTLMLLVLIVVVIAMNQKSKKDALIINIAGKQRMLTQKMSKEIFFLHFKDGYDFRELNRAVDLFEYNLKNLIEGNTNKQIEPPSDTLVKKKLEEVKAKWIPFQNEIKNIEKGINNIKDEVSILTTKTEKLLNASNEIVAIMVEEKLQPRYIDLSGRQRMLSQRMGLFLRRYLKNGDQESFLFFNDAKSIYNATIEDFMKDELIKSKKRLYLQISNTYSYWQTYKELINALVKEEKSINSSINYIYQNNTKLLDAMDEAVWLYTLDSENKNRLFLWVMYAISIIAILVTLYAYILTKDINLHVEDFVNKAKMLANSDLSKISQEDLLIGSKEVELEEASSHLRDFVKKVNNAMQHSNDTITKAESVADELQKIAQGMGQALEQLNIDESEKDKLNKKVNAVEDIAIESTENLIYVSKMLTKLQKTLADMTRN